MDKSHYGRKWLLKIVALNGTTTGTEISIGNDGFSGVEPLRVTFEVNYPGYEGWYYSEFNIYNPMKATEKMLIKEGDQVTLSAGYSETDGGHYGLIFAGTVFQPLYSRENVTDYKLTLICMDGEKLFNNVTAFSTGKYKQAALMNMIAARSYSPITVGEISKLIGKDEKNVEMDESTRGATYMCSPATAMREACKTNGAKMFMKENKLQVIKVEEAPTGNYIEITRNNGLIGTPRQIDYGISFRTLLNPELILDNPLRWVKLDMSQISIHQQRAIYGNEPVAELPIDGYFKIGGVRHVGDTRGDEWYTDVIGYSLAGKVGLQLQVPTMFNQFDGTKSR
jgi:hypothetical protein